MIKLKHLQLLHCYRIKKIPNEIGNLINLKSIEIESSALKEIPKEIKKLVNLEYISIAWGGYAKELPKEILSFDKLKDIHITKIRMPISVSEFF